MNLTFSKEYPWGGKTHFREKIQEWEKTHTFRNGFNWDTEKKIHFWDGNPRTQPKYTGLQYEEKAQRFNLDYRYPAKPSDRRHVSWYTNEDLPNWGAGEDLGDMYYPTHEEALPMVKYWERYKIIITKPGWTYWYLLIEGQLFGEARITGQYKAAYWSIEWKGERLQEIAERDGFNTVDAFVNWWIVRAHKTGTPIFDGQIIHWTGKPYTEQGYDNL
jgi:hypothetical protein